MPLGRQCHPACVECGEGETERPALSCRVFWGGRLLLLCSSKTAANQVPAVNPQKEWASCVCGPGACSFKQDQARSGGHRSRWGVWKMHVSHRCYFTGIWNLLLYFGATRRARLSARHKAAGSRLLYLDMPAGSGPAGSGLCCATGHFGHIRASACVLNADGGASDTLHVT
jgi:hypothetical protein